jgi:hypothetical protein
MKLFRISQIENNGYDTYDSAVVVAESAEAAQLLNPMYGDSGIVDDGLKWGNSCWVGPEFVSVEYLGEAAEGMRAGIICASFNAG